MKKIFVIIILITLGFSIWFLVKKEIFNHEINEKKQKVEDQKEEIENLIKARREVIEKDGNIDPFGEDGLLRVLLLGLDMRVGEKVGHCDAIQMIEIDKKRQRITITAVPRGTYSPLPPGGKYLPSDYYVAKACEVGGLDYGVKQIEKILSQKTDYLVILGFSEALGTFRYLGLPTTETLQWLRLRQGYAIGEPQRAHNHSTFLKQMIIKFTPKKDSTIDKVLQYILYKTVKTDLSFAEVRKVIDAVSEIDPARYPERIRLAMKPAYAVQDIPYDEEYLSEYLEKMIKPVKDLLPGHDYSGLTLEEAQAKLLEIINEKKDNHEFILWAFENKLWLQIEDREKRLSVQYDFLERYLMLLADKSEQKNVISDYILEMEYHGETAWAKKGKELLKNEIL